MVEDSVADSGLTPLGATGRPSTLDEETIRSAMRQLMDPELGDNVVDLGMYRSASISTDGTVTVELALTTAACPLRGELVSGAERLVGALDGVTSVSVRTGELSRSEKAALMARARWKTRQRAPQTDIPATARIIAISSGKGGVGKSSVTVNLATTLAERGMTVGVLDADIAGFSIPRMLGIEGQISVTAPPVTAPPVTALPVTALPVTVADPEDSDAATAEPTEPRPADASADDNRRSRPQAKMKPIERHFGTGVVKVLSMGFLSGEDEAIMWRGLMLNRAVQHFVEDAMWGDLDVLLIDMPPGTGDIQMGVARMLPTAQTVIVTTPALAAQKVAARAADMSRKGYLRVAGVIENMSSFTCEHGERYELFGSGGGARLAEEIGAPLLGSIPIVPALSAGGDAGAPACLEPGPVADAFGQLADRLLEAVPAPMPVVMADCTAHMFDAVEAALGQTPLVSATAR